MAPARHHPLLHPMSATQPNLPDLPSEAVLVAGGDPAKAAAGGRRQLERAPILLRRAAVLLMVAGLLPWVGHGGTWVTFVLAKALIALGGLLFLQSIKVRTGETIAGGLGGLAKVNWGPQPGQKAKGLQAALGFIPTPLHVIAWLLTIAGLIVPAFDPAAALETFSFGKALTEVGLFAWGIATFVHIAAYERGGGFSPVYPFVFLAPGLGGAFTLTRGLAASEKDPLAILGAALATASGVLAVYTISVAIMQAKKQGDAKREAALAARRAQRKPGGAGAAPRAR